MRVLSRTWQMLLKGIAEVQAAGRPIDAAEMVLVRIAYAADLPTPDEAIRAIDQGGTTAPQGNGGAGTAPSASSAPRFEGPRGGPRAAIASAPQSNAPAPQPSAIRQDAPVRAIATFAEVVALAAEQRDLQMKAALEREMRLVRCEDGRLEIALEPGAPKALVNDLSRKLQQWTGRRWMVIVSAEHGGSTLRAQADAKRVELETGVRADPLVRAVLDRFPGAEIVGVRGPNDEASGPPGETPHDDENTNDGLNEGLGDNWVRDDGE
jgi:DNA polymerase-3 subunit gamma/tau